MDFINTDYEQNNSTINFPDVIRIESCGSCNFNCIHCPNGHINTSVHRGNIKLSIYNALLAQFIDNKYVPRVVVFYHGGEPLLNKNLPTMISDYKKLGVKKTVITSNMSLLDENMAFKLTESGLDEMQASFDGESPQENDAIRKNGNFEHDSKNLEKFLTINQTTHVKISNVRICSESEIHRYLAGEALSPPEYLLRKFSGYKNVSFQSFPAMVWPTQKKYTTPNTKILSLPTDRIKQCNIFNETITIMANGDVVPCCYDVTGYEILGNIAEESIFSIRNNSRTRAFYEALSRQYRLPALCNDCFLNNNTYLIRQ